MKNAVIILLVVFLVAPVLARQDDKPIKLQADLVTLDVTVTDKDGNFLRGLKEQDFVVYEDEQPQRLGFFEAHEQEALTRPLAAVFVLDVSGSITPEEIERQREAAKGFIRLVQPESVFAVVTFNHRIQVLQDFTNDATKIGRAFEKIKDTTGTTRLFAAIDQSVAMLKKVPHYRKNRRLRRVVIVITDGYDSVDSTEQKFLIQQANNAGVTVYSITQPSYGVGALGGISSQRIMTLLDVSRIVPSTGGADFSADVGDFTPVFKAISEEIRASYTLAYYPPAGSRKDERPRQIRVEVKKPGALIRASRSSYQATSK